MTKKNAAATAMPLSLQTLYGEKRYHSLDIWLKRTFGGKTIKLAIDGGFTCPNRDGSKGTDGCLFCSESGAGEFASTIEDQIALYARKWPHAQYLAYFQNHTNTYGPVDVLRRRFTEALAHPAVKGLVIGTRPDCLPEDVLDLISALHEHHFLWVELGLQTVHEETARAMNRGYPLSDYDRAAAALAARGIPFVTHLLFGLPGETAGMMLESVRYVAGVPGLSGVKFHLLNVVRGSGLAAAMPDYVPFPSMDAYVDLVVRALELLPPQVVVHRLTGDAPRPLLISPAWSYRKRSILNAVDQRLHLLDSWQGKDAGGL